MHKHDKEGHVPLEEIDESDWLVYLGTLEDSHGWAHVLIEREDLGKLILCAHNRNYPDGTVLYRVNSRSVYRGDTAVGLAKRMKFWDPRKEAADE